MVTKVKVVLKHSDYQYYLDRHSNTFLVADQAKINYLKEGGTISRYIGNKEYLIGLVDGKDSKFLDVVAVIDRTEGSGQDVEDPEELVDHDLSALLPKSEIHLTED